MVRWGLRVLFWTHRWSGVVLALLMTSWALSGVVMMYVAYPETTREERFAGLAPLDLTGCCKADLPDIPQLGSASVEMLEGVPVLRWQDGVVRLSDGKAMEIGSKDAALIAADHLARASGTEVQQPTITELPYDQWTVQGASSRTYPLYKASFTDPAGTVLYVSGKDGRIVQDTTRAERFWNWLGAIPHWLYFAELRKDGWMWQQVVVYTSLLGTFLTVTGLYIGIRQYGRGKRRIPYRGWSWWHHVTGLVFGIFTLTWIVSGLFSMQPWGWMESPGADAEQAALAGRPVEPADAATLIAALRAGVPAGTASADLSLQGKTAFAILSDAQGKEARYALPSLKAAPPGVGDLRDRSLAALPGVALKSAELIHQPDDYYYSHHSKVSFPVWRAIYGDADATRLYFDPATGELIARVDKPAREFRWWHLALHRLDFGPFNQRPVWDIVMLPLILGVSLLCVVGLWLGVKRLRRSFARKSRLPARASPKPRARSAN